MAQRRAIGGGAYATEHTQRMGSVAEEQFEFLCKGKGYKIRCASKYENMVKHFDFEVSTSQAPLQLQERPFGLRAKVEVKSVKCPVRGAAPDPTLIYCELQSVGGHKGWVYGEADYIAFQQTDSKFLCMRRAELAAFVDRFKSNAPTAARSGKRGTLYSRADRNDLVLVLDRDLHIKPHVPHFIFE